MDALLVMGAWSLGDGNTAGQRSVVGSVEVAKHRDNLTLSMVTMLSDIEDVQRNPEKTLAEDWLQKIIKEAQNMKEQYEELKIIFQAGQEAANLFQGTTEDLEASPRSKTSRTDSSDGQ